MRGDKDEEKNESREPEPFYIDLPNNALCLFFPSFFNQPLKPPLSQRL